MTARSEMSHSIALRGGGCHHAAEPSGGEDVDVEAPVCRGDSSAFHVHAPLARVLSPTLIRAAVLPGRPPWEQRLAVAQALHGGGCVWHSDRDGPLGTALGGRAAPGAASRSRVRTTDAPP